MTGTSVAFCMVNSFDDWLRYAMGAVSLALGISLCFVPREKLLIQLGSKRPPVGAKPIPRWVGVLMSLSIALLGADMLAYKLILSQLPRDALTSGLLRSSSRLSDLGTRHVFRRALS